VVWDEGLSQQARQHLAALGYDGIIKYHVGEAVQTLRNTAGPFDLIFNDINKEGYADSLPVIAEKLRPGGVLVVDNMLWHGNIFDDKDKSPATTGVRKLTEMLIHSPDWIMALVPVRDGVAVAYKR
jgi:caffeoyl-CoA O-methyltransferase